MSIDLEKLQDSPHLLDILLQMEDVLDSLDVYVFKNWYLGEIAEGPVVRRYWLDFTLKYAHDKMPDPDAAMRLLKHGIRVDFWKAVMSDEGEYVDADNDENPNAMTANEKAAEEGKGDVAEENTVWMVRISIPRRLAAQMSSEEMDFYDEEVDVDDVEDAKDTGIDDESAYDSDEQQADLGDEEPAPGDDQQAPAPPGGPNGF